MRNANVQARGGGHIAAGALRCQGDDVGATHFEIGAQQTNVVVTLAAHRALPLHAKFGRFFSTHLGNQAFHKHLGATRIQLVDDCAQLAVLRFGCCDDERVGGRIGLNLTACGRLCATGEIGIGTTCGAGIVRGGGCRHRGATRVGIA